MTEPLPPGDPHDALIREQAALLKEQAEQIAALTALVPELGELLDAAIGGRLPGRRPPARKERLIRAWHAARDHGLPAVPDDVCGPLELEFRRAVTVGLAAVRRVPGPRTAVRQ